VARKTPSYVGLTPASERASRAARGSSRKRDTKPEKLLRSLLWKRGLRFRKDYAALPGRPDIVFTKAKVVVFVDGDFWHGRDWAERKAKLANGNNAGYWIAKIGRNMERDREHRRQLEAYGWRVLRFWESVIKRNPEGVAEEILTALEERRRD